MNVVAYIIFWFANRVQSNDVIQTNLNCYMRTLYTQVIKKEFIKYIDFNR